MGLSDVGKKIQRLPLLINTFCVTSHNHRYCSRGGCATDIWPYQKWTLCRRRVVDGTRIILIHHLHLTNFTWWFRRLGQSFRRTVDESWTFLCSVGRVRMHETRMWMTPSRSSSTDNKRFHYVILFTRSHQHSNKWSGSQRPFGRTRSHAHTIIYGWMNLKYIERFIGDSLCCDLWSVSVNWWDRRRFTE